MIAFGKYLGNYADKPKAKRTQRKKIAMVSTFTQSDDISSESDEYVNERLFNTMLKIGSGSLQANGSAALSPILPNEEY